VWSASGDQIWYLHTDHLGSIDTITDGSGAARHLKYDPFGRRVQPDRLDQAASVDPLDERRGFAGQEHDDELTLINMKGRMYDPLSGRFLTTDPVISDRYFGQAYNHYSYVWNNPLTLTDPTGFENDRGFWDSFSVFSCRSRRSGCRNSGSA
jgi:RHS repeat-associated protein